MKQIRKISGNPIFIILLTFSFLFASCSEESIVPNTIDNISGKELFKSIVFADGSITSDIPALQKVGIAENLTAEQLIEFRTFQNKAIEYLESTDENYFKNFKQNIMTRDVETISKTLSDSSKSLEPLVNIIAKDKNLNLAEIKAEITNNNGQNLKGPQEIACLLIVIILLVWYWYTKELSANNGSNTLSSETNIVNNTVSIQLVDYLTID